MDRQSTPTQSELKSMLFDEKAEPKALPLSLLEEITKGFSEEQEIGRGGFAVVYKGVLDNGMAIAVKRLSHAYMYEKQIHREIECLIKVKHENVVRFIGYCVDTQGVADSYDGKFVMADIQQRLLCFEYLPHGTLDKYITDASCGLDWRMRYRIIHGICDGLHYLHQNQIVHLDLKPPNILLDGNMLPKIADFGLSRCFEEKQSRAITSKIVGTIGYLAPEFGSREITYRFDLYSLGVIIIEILTGRKGYEDVENVLESWSNRLEKSHRDIQRVQIRVCTEIGIECIESNPAKRPVSMQHIIARLDETGTIEGFIETVMTRSSTLQDLSFSGSSISIYGTDSATRTRNNMEHARVPPRPLRLHYLEEITNNFSQERRLGVGAFGSVYEGRPKDGEKIIAVKKLHDHMFTINDKLFDKEYHNFANLEHQNIVRLVGYCIETRKEYKEFDGRTVLTDIQHMALCFEFMCNGSLANYLQDESTGEDWHTRYAIIKGICKGLKYLHEELNPPVYHLDLKPGNILLDEKMTPKIADFGLSRLFGDERTRELASAVGTHGYLPPEYIEDHLVSKKLDIFSLGVIIVKLMTGPVGYSRTREMSSKEFIELTHGKWRKRLQQTSNVSNESYGEQVKTCIKIALSCLEDDRGKRPKIGDIVNELDHTETTTQLSHALTINQGSMAVEEEMSPFMPTNSELVDVPESMENELLNVHSRRLRFPFFEPNKSISCPVRLSNNTYADVAFRVLPKHPERYIDGLLNLSGIVPPRSTCTYPVLLEKQPPSNLEEFDVTLQSCIAHNDIEDVDDNFIPDIIELTDGNKLHEVTLMATICYPTGQHMTSELSGRQTKIICSNIEQRRYIVIMETHPTEPWIVAGHFDGSISVWNYDTEARIMEFRVVQGAVRSVIFIAREQWIVAGDNKGQIHVRSCMTTDEVTRFQPHSTWIFALAVHPNLPLLLSAGEDNLIKLWDWKQGWKCLRTFRMSTRPHETIMFTPSNDSTGIITFMTVSMDGKANIGGGGDLF